MPGLLPDDWKPDTGTYDPNLPHTGEDRAHAIPIDTVGATTSNRDALNATAKGAVMVDTQAPPQPPPKLAAPAPSEGLLPPGWKPPQSAQDAISESLNQGDTGGVPDTRTAGLEARGLIKGAASIATAPIDLGTWARNWAKKNILGMPEDQIDRTDASDVLNKGLNAVGFPQPKGTGENAIDLASSIAGGALTSGGAGALGAAKDATGNTGTASRWWSWANANGGQNQKIVNNLAARELGQQGDKLNATVLGAARKDIGSDLDAGRNANNILLMAPAEVQSKIGAINGTLTPKTGAIINHDAVDRLLTEISGGSADGHTLGEVSSKLSGSAAGAMNKGDFNLGTGLYQARDYVESLITSGMSDVEKQTYQQALNRYKMLENLEDSGAVNSSSGNVNGASLANYLQKIDKHGFMEGGNNSPLYQVLHMAQGDSAPSLQGTAQALGQSRAMIFAKTIAKLGPTVVQSVAQRGIAATARASVNTPGFMSALQQTLQETGQKPPQ